MLASPGTSSSPVHPNRGETWDPVLGKFIESTGSDAVSFAKLARDWTIPGVLAIAGFVGQLLNLSTSFVPFNNQKRNN